MGRPTVFDEATVQKLEDAFREGFSVATACSLSGISRSAYYDHYNANEDFKDKMKVAREWVTQRAKQVVVKAINNNDLSAAKWWLERRGSDEFGKHPISEKQEEEDIRTKAIEDRMKAFLEQPVEYYRDTV